MLPMQGPKGLIPQLAKSSTIETFSPYGYQVVRLNRATMGLIIIQRLGKLRET